MRRAFALQRGACNRRPTFYTLGIGVTILELIQKTTAWFEKAGVPDPRLDVELLLAHVLHLKRMDLYLQFERPLTEPELDTLRPLVKRRAAREPLQHILGSVEFWGLELSVNRQALIPRPETEILVQAALALLGNEPSGIILDIGTGTGAIALALLHACPKLRCVATDLSADALDLAQANAQKTGVQERVEFRRGNLLEPIQPGEAFDLVVSNPPYIPTGEIPGLQAEVRHDPTLALDGGADGLDLIRKLITGAPPFLKSGGWLLFEIGHNQADRVRQLLTGSFWSDLDFVRDLRGIPRVAKARKN